MRTVVLFTYGTLRRGEPLEGYMYNASDCYPGTIRGRLYECKYGEYPVADLESAGTIVGDAYLIDPRDLGFLACVRMERGAGYEPREVTVETNSGIELAAIAFHYPDTSDYGPRIRDGDWVRHIDNRHRSRYG